MKIEFVLAIVHAVSGQPYSTLGIYESQADCNVESDAWNNKFAPQNNRNRADLAAVCIPRKGK